MRRRRYTQECSEVEELGNDSECGGAGTGINEENLGSSGERTDEAQRAK